MFNFSTNLTAQVKNILVGLKVNETVETDFSTIDKKRLASLRCIINNVSKQLNIKVCTKAHPESNKLWIGRKD